MDFDIHAAIKDTLSITEALIQKSGITLELKLNSKKSIIRGNFSKMQQLIMNLLTNAIDALDGIKNGYIHIETQDGENEVVLRVSDNGCGIAPENIEKIYDPFFTTKPQGKGTGLGLYIIMGIVKSFGGVVQVESQKGLGTSFIFRFPYNQTN